ncbi:LutB/LldF family L-lactate oxidation iron-sulfur protein [Cohaesibacter celericrescens]|uniref:Iron-sulfur cluster-binding protein n=1 Tax=Cohaesibacter celericrescens TaxID=2067669 RepID=A0A2N5XKM8_9HYPH|nr:LutB/LldF family L-lactate oxidation iron-sulfur protein [Cohaesibacter celericrescens]PLW74998.1 iron-sulfur cluster-binding protein [Cohaesibacter celericrescens]
MEIKSPTFKQNSREALADVTLQKALKNVEKGFIGKRQDAVDALPEFEDLRNRGRAIKTHTLKHLDLYLEEYEKKVVATGGHVHWAETGGDACEIVKQICQTVNAKTVTKGKSMISEEMQLNAFLEKDGMDVIETDLGEYIIQLRGEIPSHIIAPAVHVTKEQVEADFRRAHTHLDSDRNLDDPTSLLGEAREVLREKYFAADVGITGANFLIAETGSSVIVTNEGNGDLTQTLSRVHIVLASIEKLVPTMNDADQLLRLLARSATGQEQSVYTTFSTGARREEDPDGPEEYHVILLDNGRSSMLGTEFEEMLRCIRCAACMNHCPVYHAVGGHAYGWVYPGPMGSVLTPSLIGVDKAGHLPNASTLCGRCESVCPMKIPLPKMMRHWREKEYERHLNPSTQRWGLKGWAFLATRPRLYHWAMGLGMGVMKHLAPKTGLMQKLPMTGAWTKHRELPAPEGKTFQQMWADKEKKRKAA